jgi:hypothetical protein
MEPDDKTQTSGSQNLTGEENNTLHNAGVDLEIGSGEQSDVVDIDNIGASDPDLKDVGISFTKEENKEDLSLLKEKMDKERESKDVATPASDNPIFQDIPKVSPEPAEVTAEKKEKIAPQKPAKTEANTEDLEKEFNQTVGVSSGATTKDLSLNEKVFSMQSMLAKIKEKLSFKKAEVKEELDRLKKVKEDIAKDIANIKELEESEQKIEAELKKVEDIKNEIGNIEKEVEEELKS